MLQRLILMLLWRSMHLSDSQSSVQTSCSVSVLAWSTFRANSSRADVYVEEYPVEGLPHGYGLGFQGDVWTDKFDAFLQKVMKK